MYITKNKEQCEIRNSLIEISHIIKQQHGENIPYK